MMILKSSRWYIKVLICFTSQVICGKQPQTSNSKGGSYQDNTAGAGSHDGEVVSSHCVNSLDR